MKLFEIVEEDAKCGGCNWEASHQYVLADTEEQARAMYKKGEAGLCGDCMCDLIVKQGYVIDLDAKKAAQVEKDIEKRAENAARKLKKKME